ncbi:MAG: integrase [Cardiobacteriales bacterium]|nr:MAG: integrase [Cardiobacteriales bacterium]
MKLPKPRKRGYSYYIELMYNRKRYSCTRDTARECERWAASKLLELKAGVIEHKKQKQITFYELFVLYEQRIGRKMKSARGIRYQLKVFKNKLGVLSATSINEITPQMISAWRDKRLTEVKSATVKREINLYSAVMSYAQKHLFLIDENPFLKVKKPVDSKARYRRISNDEIARILKSCDYDITKKPSLTMHYVAWAFLFAIETAMRRGEILAIKKENVFDDHIYVADSKTGDSRNVPLSFKARELIKVLDWDNGRAVPRSGSFFEKEWQKAKHRANLHDLHFHDTRHEAISRMVKERKMPVEILAKLTGHKEIATLVNIYYNPDARELVEYFNKHQ